MVEKPWWVYMIRCNGRTLYTGITTDVIRRLKEHRTGSPRGARYTRSCRSLELVYKIEVANRSQAARMEWGIKNLSKKRKEELVRLAPDIRELFRILELDLNSR